MHFVLYKRRRKINILILILIHIYLENHSVCPLVRIGTPHPLSCKHLTGWGVPIRTTGEKAQHSVYSVGCLKSAKINKKKGYKELALIIDVYTRYREKIIHVSSRYQIFDPGSHMIRSEHIKSCLTAQIRFLLFKRQVSFK